MALTFEEQLKNLKETLGTEEEITKVRAVIKNHSWRFAESYADFCPHEYTLRKNGWTDEEFDTLVHHVWKYGLIACFGKQSPKPYWFNHADGYYYFLLDGDVDETGHVKKGCILLNRASMKYFDFWVEEDLLGRIVRCKVKPGGARMAKEDRERERVMREGGWF